MSQAEAVQYGLQSQIAVQQWLESHGVRTETVRHGLPFDLIANGKRVEIKAARLNPDKQGWSVNFHRHGILDETDVDVYVVRLEGFNGEAAVHLIFGSPIQRKTLWVSPRSLRNIYARFIDRIDALGGRQTPRLAASRDRRPPRGRRCGPQAPLTEVESVVYWTFVQLRRKGASVSPDLLARECSYAISTIFKAIHSLQSKLWLYREAEIDAAYLDSLNFITDRRSRKKARQ